MSIKSPNFVTSVLANFVVYLQLIFFYFDVYEKPPLIMHQYK